MTYKKRIKQLSAPQFELRVAKERFQKNDKATQQATFGTT